MKLIIESKMNQHTEQQISGETETVKMEAMCTGCLSTDRKLNYIVETEYYHVYTQILNEIPVYDLTQVCIRICWECRARLRSMQRFKLQVQRNYADLMQHIPPQGKSTLSTHSQYIFSYPDVSSDVKTESYDDVIKIKTQEFEKALDVDTVDVTRDVIEHIPPQGKSTLSTHSQYIFSYPDVSSDVKTESYDDVIKIETQEFEKALDVDTVDVTRDVIEPLEKKSPKTKRKKSKKLKVKKKRKKKNSVEIEPAENGLDSHDDMEDSHISEDHGKESLTEESHMEDNHTEESHLKENFDKEDTVLPDLTKEDESITKEQKVTVKRKRNSEALPDRPQCQECGKVFSSKKTYRYHLNVLHKGQNQYPCPRCGKVYQWKSNLGRHMRSHKAVDDGELFCALCDKSFASVATYRQHLRISRRHVPETEFSFACESCGKRFVNKTRLRDHIDWEHLQKIKFRCQMCDKPFKCHTSLYVHLQNVHTTHKRRENLCHVCGKSYQNAAKLKYHITAMHSGDTPYRCAECGACFGWYSSLYRHTREVHYKMKGLSKKAKKAKQSRGSPVPLNQHYPPLAPI